MKNRRALILFAIVVIFLAYGCSHQPSGTSLNEFRRNFIDPPNAARPGVYWYFMDGNLSGESMTKDLESMKKAGIGNVVFLEVNVGVPRGPENLLSERWKELFAHAVHECERLGIEMTMGIGPGWTGSGGPWVPLTQSMQHLVFSSVTVSQSDLKIKLSVPPPRPPFFGEGVFSPLLKKEWMDFYEDVAVLAFPTPSSTSKIADINEKALYFRAPFSSAPGVKPFLTPSYSDSAADAPIDKNRIIDLTDKLQPDGTLNWKAPAGSWTVMRFGRRNNGSLTRPAPVPGLGFESDKFDTVAINAHLNNYIGQLLKSTGPVNPRSSGGLKRLHMDSWEMSSQNWTGRFREEFKKRRGYDPLPFYPVYAGTIVQSREMSERFLWDLRQTSQELVIEFHAGQVKKYAKRNGLRLSIEPYDMNPTSDLELGSVADVPMCEFWSKNFGFNSSFSCIEATSVAHVKSISLVPAEAFTAEATEGWKQYPGSMKNQGDWAFAAGINRFVFHTFQNQYLNDSLKPGMTMGPYGVHWNRSQTWWPMVNDYHHYISSCSYLLQQGRSVADVLYLAPEGSPHVFRPPFSAILGDTIGDRKGYNFDGCAPGELYHASISDGAIVFPGGSAYRLLVLPFMKTMTPALLNKIKTLVSDGATVVGAPPERSPGLSGYPACDSEVLSVSKELWGSVEHPRQQTVHSYGKGKLIWGGDLDVKISNLYPEYDLTAAILKSLKVEQDFESNGPLRYTHRTAKGWDIYFVSNKTGAAVSANAVFRSAAGKPQLWDAVTSEIRPLPEFSAAGGRTTIPLQFDAYQSYFIVFSDDNLPEAVQKKNFTSKTLLTTLQGAWDVAFDPKWGGPEHIVFNELQDWIKFSDEGIKYYSGIAVYKKKFDLPQNENKGQKLFLDLGKVNNLARIKFNGKDLGVVWTAPWRVEITSLVQQGDNTLEIEVANLWPNRLIGDEKKPDDGIKNNQWPAWLSKGLHRTSGRYTFTTFRHYDASSPLLESGLLGPVTIMKSE